MLETLPIVKFGDPEPVKPGSREIELEDGNASVHQASETTAAAESTPAHTHQELKAVPAAETVESGMNPNTQAESIRSGEEPPADGELGCSICTEDFTTGEDVRVLPCKHKYHPACIDPWLLNVSGTCPLWYIPSSLIITICKMLTIIAAATISAPSHPPPPNPIAQAPKAPKATNSLLP